MTEKTPQPSFVASTAKEGKDGKSYFTKIGAAFPHKDGEGHNIQLDALPMDGTIILRTPKERLDAKREGAEKPRQSQSHEW